MKFWVPILLLLIVLLIAILWRSRERFSSGAKQPICPDGLTLVGEKCRGEGAMPEEGQCPEGMEMNEEGMCQQLADPTCEADHTLTIENGIAMCEPNNRPAEPTDEELYAQQQAAEAARAALDEPTPICPSGTTNDQWNRCVYPDVQPSRSCPAGTEYIHPVRQCKSSADPPVFSDPICPAGTIFEKHRDGCTKPHVAPTCPTGYVLESGTGGGYYKCKRPTAAPAAPAAPAAETTTTESGVTPATVRKNNILGPVFTSYEAPLDGGTDSHRTNQYPELLGGGDPASRNRESGAGTDLKGSMPSADSLGTTEMSKFFPFSRQPGDMDLIPDPYRVSQQFSSASYSFKTEPTPFLTDFSAFLR